MWRGGLEGKVQGTEKPDMFEETSVTSHPEFPNKQLFCTLYTDRPVLPFICQTNLSTYS